MKAMIFSAGVGSRLKPLTNSLPKALVEVGGKTLLQRAVESLLHYGINEMVVNVHHFSHLIKDYLTTNNNFGASIHISDETDCLLDTGGGLIKARSFFKPDDTILALNVDVVSNIDYLKMYNYHRKNNALATLAVRNRQSGRYFLFDQELLLSGWKNARTNQKVMMCEKEELTALAFSGIQILSPGFFDYAPQKDVFGLVEWYLDAAKSNRIKAYVHDTDYWFDAGTVEKINSIEKFLEHFN
jgi:NDP-sugar pyrophosphorylase family protein